MLPLLWCGSRNQYLGMPAYYLDRVNMAIRHQSTAEKSPTIELDSKNSIAKCIVAGSLRHRSQLVCQFGHSTP